MRAASSASPVLGLAGLLAALAFLGGSAPVGGVMAALNAETDNSISATGHSWSVIVNGSVGAPASWATVANNTRITFPVENNGNTDITGMTITVTNNTGRNFRICPNGGNCNNNGGGAVNVASGDPPTVITHTAVQRPSTAGSSVTWSFRKTQNGTLSTPLSISASVTSDQIAAGTPSDG